MSRVSVVIPIYNAARYLGECLQSVLDQTLREIEVICVDDASVDRSAELLRDAADRDSRIRIVRQAHGGAATARNRGMEEADGDYIAFLDADDFYPTPNSLQILYEAAKRAGADVVGGSFSEMDARGKRRPRETYDGESFYGYFFDREGWIDYRNWQFDFGFTRFLYRRTFLVGQGLKFPALALYEDPPFLVRTLLAAERFYAVPETVYCCRTGHKGVVRYWDGDLHDLTEGLTMNLETAKREGLEDLYRLTKRRMERVLTASAEDGRNVRASASYRVGLAVTKLPRMVVHAVGEMRYKVSVVTAVCNVAPYLEEMIGSIRRQTIGFHNIQLILVDDGSTDDSGAICDRYAKRYPRNIMVIHQKNKGVSAARNNGLRHIEGKYVNFCDADDKLSRNALKRMYDFMEAHREEIDVVSIPMRFFDARQGEHVLNYKYKKTAVVDLKEQYDYIQLSMSSAMVKSECLRGRAFDERLAYIEDMRLVNEILMDKMRCGVVHDAAYYCRKRRGHDSASDSGCYQASWYLPPLRYAHQELLDMGAEKYGDIPEFIQYVCMYDLQWRISLHPCVKRDALSAEEEQKYIDLLWEILRRIDDDIIERQRWLRTEQQYFLHRWKREKDDSKWRLKKAWYEFLEIANERIVLEGHLLLPVSLRQTEIYCKEIVSGTRYPAEVYDRTEKDLYSLSERIARGVGFVVRIPDAEGIYLLCVRADGQERTCERVVTGKFFPLTDKLKRSYLFRGGMLFTWRDRGLCVQRKEKTKHTAIRREWLLLWEMLCTRDCRVLRGMAARIGYHILRPWKKRELWLVSDRLERADDNGEALFRYLCAASAIKKKADVRFVIKKNTADYARLCEIGRVENYDSLSYKFRFLLADKIISSSGDEWVINRFFDRHYLYQDILYGRSFVFLQHGVTKDDQSKWLNRFNRNIDILVTATRAEHKAFLQSSYYYNERQIRQTGFPRFDLLCDDDRRQKFITVMPTWRKWLTSGFDIKTASRMLTSDFSESRYCQMYSDVLSNERLFGEAAKLGYRIRLMLHPSMPRECLAYLPCHRDCEILDFQTSYREIYAESKLIVTDYSSAVFDFAYLKKPVLYYQADADEFFSGKHSYDKGYFDYERDGFGEVTHTAEGLIDLLIEYMENDCRLKDKYRTRIDHTFAWHDRDNCKRVYEAICSLKKEQRD